MNAKVTINGLRENNNRICLYVAVSLSLYSSFPMYISWKQTLKSEFTQVKALCL